MREDIKAKGPSQFLSMIEKLFYLDLDLQTSACLYGSALTGDWVSSRSDLDLFVFLPEEKLELFGGKIKAWHSNPDFPVLDGFIVYQTSRGLMVREFHKFGNGYRLTEKFITLIDLWNIKYRSKHLFGQDVTAFIREISQVEVKRWSFKYIEEFWIPLLRDLDLHGDVRANIPLSTLVWTASGVARVLMLTGGTICSSKREALNWLGAEYPEISGTINELKNQFGKPDDGAFSLTGQQAKELGLVYLKILERVKT